METIAEEWMIYRTPNPTFDGVCAVEVLQHGDGRHVVIVEELDDNPGESVSNVWESVVTAICEKYRVPVLGTVWIEHDTDPESPSVRKWGHWQIVTFSDPKAGETQGKANWREMTADDWHELGLKPRK